MQALGFELAALFDSSMLYISGVMYDKHPPIIQTTRSALRKFGPCLLALFFERRRGSLRVFLSSIPKCVGASSSGGVAKTQWRGARPRIYLITILDACNSTHRRVFPKFLKQMTASSTPFSIRMQIRTTPRTNRGFDKKI